jgi:hypothetical protein
MGTKLFTRSYNKTAGDLLSRRKTPSQVAEEVSSGQSDPVGMGQASALREWVAILEGVGFDLMESDYRPAPFEVEYAEFLKIMETD